MVNNLELKNFRQDQLLLDQDVKLGPVPQYLLDELALDTRRVRIEKATEPDVPDICRLMRGLAEYEGLDHLMVATPRDLRTALFGFRSSAEALVAFFDDECVAYAIFFPTYCGMLGQRGMFLENIFVDPEFRDCGIGKALLGRAAAIALQRSCVALHWRVLSDNLPAIGFYAAQGAEIMCEWSTCRMGSDALERLAQRSEVSSPTSMEGHAGASAEFDFKEGHRLDDADEQIRRTA